MQKNNLFVDTLTTVTKYLRILVVIVIVGICLSGVRVVKSGNVALVIRCGKLVGKIGVIGPTRMKYDEVTSIMEYLTNNLSESFRLTDDSGDGNAGDEDQHK